MGSPASTIAAALPVADRLASIARPIVAKYFRQPLDIETKEDLSPVTIADRSIEAAIRAELKAVFPDHGVLGEEFGDDRIESEWVWVIDPIDGTKAFITGSPLFGTLISLCHWGKPVVGVMDCPALNERWVGAAGHGAWYNMGKVKTRPCPTLNQAISYSSSPQMFQGADEAPAKRFAAAVKLPLYGGDCYGYALMAAGWSDMVLEARLKPYDYCAIVPIIEGAGGVVSDWAGRPLVINSDGRMLACGDPALQAQAVAVLDAA
jgi:inositol-phosphate phosphatase/L-galactose 1-phosphate phosphatase/histidinol-phosphatase